MQFVKYPSITNTFRGDSLDYIRLNHAEELANVSWHVYEKIHGSNFSMWCDGKEVKFAKRSGFLDKGAKFFNWQEVADLYLPNLLALHGLVGKPVVVYGELYGGKYNGKTSGSLVQKEVQYCPHNDFSIFDIGIINEDNTITFENEDDFHERVFTSGFRLAPYLAKYDTLEEALKCSNKFITMVPSSWSLPPLPNNYCEGVVIKPSVPILMHDGSRVIFKNKNENFKEGGEVIVDTCATSEFICFLKLLKTNITKNRFDNVVSKLGLEEAPEVYFNEFVKDALDDMPYEEYLNFTDQQKRLLNRLVAQFVWPIIKDVITFKEKAQA